MRTDEAALAAAANQLQEFKKIISAAYGMPVADGIMEEGVYVFDGDLEAGFEKKRWHSSKSIKLPIVGACSMRDPQNVTIDNLSDNFHFYFMSLHLKQAIPATLLWPISGVFGSVPLSGHVTDRNFITNFAKAYHNVQRLDKLSFSFNSPLEGALIIRYLNEVSKLPIDDILNMVLFKTDYGLMDNIDFNAVSDNRELCRLCGVQPSEKGYCNYDVEGLDPLFEEMKIDIYDLQNGLSSLHFKMSKHLPPLPVPHRSLLVPPTQELQDAGIGESSSKYAGTPPGVPVHILKRRNSYDPEHNQRWEMRTKLNAAYWRLPLDSRTFSINTPNGLDTIMTAFLLNHCLPDVWSRLEENDVVHK